MFKYPAKSIYVWEVEVETYTNPIWVLPEVPILEIVEPYWVGIEPRQPAAFEAFLQLKHPPNGDTEVDEESNEDRPAGVRIVEHGRKVITEEGHDEVLTIVLGIGGIFRVYPSTAEGIV